MINVKPCTDESMNCLCCDLPNQHGSFQTLQDHDNRETQCPNPHKVSTASFLLSCLSQKDCAASAAAAMWHASRASAVVLCEMLPAGHRSMTTFRRASAPAQVSTATDKYDRRASQTSRNPHMRCLSFPADAVYYRVFHSLGENSGDVRQMRIMMRV